MGCSPWGREELDTTERLQFHFSISCIGKGNGNPLQGSCLENPRDGGSLVGCCLWGLTESDTTERRHVHFHALEREMTTHSSVLAWRIPGTVRASWAAISGVAQSQTRLKRLSSSSRLQSMGSERVGRD